MKEKLKDLKLMQSKIMIKEMREQRIQREEEHAAKLATLQTEIDKLKQIIVELEAKK